MTEPGDPAARADLSLQEQLVKAVRDLWSMPVDSGTDYIVFKDRRALNTRVRQTQAGQFQVSWEAADDDGIWSDYSRVFENLREAALHAYQGPH